MTNKRMTISIFGPSGAGKSTIAKAVTELLGPDRAVRIPGDSFLLPAEGSLDEYWRRPLAYDWSLLGHILASPNERITSIPDFDFERFVRVSTSGGRGLIMRPIRIVDTLIPYTDADLRVRVSVPADVRRARIIARDEIWGSRVIDRWNHLEQTQREGYPENAVDLELNGLDDPMRSAARVASVVNNGAERSNGVTKTQSWTYGRSRD